MKIKSIKKSTNMTGVYEPKFYCSKSFHYSYKKGLGSLSPNEAEVSLLSDKRQIKRITGVKIQEVIRLVGGSEYKKALMRLNDIIDWEC